MFDIMVYKQYAYISIVEPLSPLHNFHLQERHPGLGLMKVFIPDKSNACKHGKGPRK